MAKNVLITGGMGNLGKVTSKYLTEKGFKVTLFDRVPVDRAAAFAPGALPYIKGDLLSLSDCMRAIAFSQADVIVHLGAIPFNSELQPPYGREYGTATDGARFVQMMNEDDTMKINTMGTYYLLDAARRMGVKDIIAATSFYAIGIGFRISGTPFPVQYLPIDEEHPVFPEDTYSLSKYLNEETMKAFSSAYGMRCVAMRLMGVYYAGQEFSEKVHAVGVPVPDPKPEEVDVMCGTTYQYVDARDIAYFIELSMKALDENKLAPYEDFFVITDTHYSEDTVDVIKKRWPSLAAKGIGMDIKGSDGLISYEKSTKLLGYTPQHARRKK